MYNVIKKPCEIFINVQCDKKTLCEDLSHPSSFFAS